MKKQIEALIGELRKLVPVGTEDEQALAQKVANKLTAILAADAGGWRGIADCPRGKIVLLFAITEFAPDGQAKNWKMATGHRCYSTGEWLWDGRRLAPYDALPTHWRPLPEPPPQEPPR